MISVHAAPISEMMIALTMPRTPPRSRAWPDSMFRISPTVPAMTAQTKIVSTRFQAPPKPERTVGSPPDSLSWAANTSALLKKMMTNEAKM